MIFLFLLGLKLTSVASYNHLDNNDGANLDYYNCFRSKEIFKSICYWWYGIYNPIFYLNSEHPDHIVFIKYVPSVGNSKRALDEYDSGIFCGGKNIISIHNTCKDNLLDAPLMVDIVILLGLFTRVEIKDETMKDFENMVAIYSVICFLFKASKT